VGANRGQFGTLLRGIGYTGWIISFEPIRASYEALKAVAASSNFGESFPMPWVPRMSGEKSMLLRRQFLALF